MSLSKLESLPNEILLDFLEKYANGVDILVTYTKQINSRIDGLIAQCQQFRFDFFRCHKDDFLYCVSLFPSLTDRITELALSEWNTPGQIHTFLSFFPSFRPFKNLRTLYFHFDVATANWKELERALCSLKKLKNLNILSIKVANKLKESLLIIIVELFRLPALKRLSIAIGDCNSEWITIIPLEPVSFNIEHLTITGIPFQWNDLQSIIQCSPYLRYFNIRLTKARLYTSQWKMSTSLKLNYVPSLQTLILNFQEEDDPTTFEMVAELLRTTHNLCRLELTAHDALIKASAWEQLIQNALPHLTRFLLKTSPSRLKKRNLQEVLFSFQTSFWIATNNFHVLILDDEHLINNKDTMNHSYGRKRQTSNHQNTEFRTPSVHSTKSNISPTNTVTTLHFCRTSSLLSCQQSFDNVRYLVIEYPEKNIIQWIIKYVNCLKIEELDISLCKHEDQMIMISLLIRTKNIKSLKLNASQLITYQTLQFETNNQLKSLAISDVTETFTENMIQTIGQLFPRIEHMVIDIPNLSNVPMLGTYLTHLRSLTIDSLGQSFHPFNSFEAQIASYQWQTENQFLFHCDGRWVTIWLDSEAFDKAFWNTFGRNLCSFAKRSVTTNDNRKKRFKF